MIKAKKAPPVERDADNFVRDMFVEKWGFGDPAPAYREAWQADLDTLHFVQGRRKA